MKTFIYALGAFFLATPSIVLAQPAYLDQVDQVGTGVYGNADSSAGNLTGFLGNIITAGMALLGLILFFIVIYAGVLWMTAGGNQDRVAKAKQMIINAVIGLVILAASFALSQFVIQSVTQALSGGV